MLRNTFTWIGCWNLPIARVYHNSSWPLHPGYHHQVRSVHVHCINTVVAGVSPVDFLLSPIIGDALRVDASVNDLLNLVASRLTTWHLRYPSPWSDLCEKQYLVFVIKINSHNIREISLWLKQWIKYLENCVDNHNFIFIFHHFNKDYILLIQNLWTFLVCLVKLPNK